MGLFHKKKSSESSSSILSESEIQKKLYGEFSEETLRVATGEREHFKEPPAPLSVKETPAAKNEGIDLFSAQKEALAEHEVSPRQLPPEPKLADHARYVPLQSFEKKPAPSVKAPSGSTPYSRFRYNQAREGNPSPLPELLKGFTEKMGEMVKFFMDPRQVVLRRVIYWGMAGLVVFLLFWGVNALNSQREEAMRARYKIPGETVSVKASTPAAAVVPAPTPVAERPVVVTPVPAKTPKTPSSAESAPKSKADLYVIQVVTYPSKPDAESVVTALKNAGFRAFLKENTRASGRVFYMVLIGGFRTAAEAQSQLLKFRGQEVARPFQDAFVRTNRT